MTSLSPAQKALYKKLSSPQKIQDYINTLKIRNDDNEPIVNSPRVAIEKMKASCIEGAMLSASILEFHGEKPLLMDLRISPNNDFDSDHVVAIFKRFGCYGAISKTSHPVLRYREPIYKTLRELALSYFHEYFTDDGKKNLRSFSKPFDITKFFGNTSWIDSNDDLYEIACALDDCPHYDILSKEQEKNLRLADAIEIKACTIQEK